MERDKRVSAGWLPRSARPDFSSEVPGQATRGAEPDQPPTTDGAADPGMGTGEFQDNRPMAEHMQRADREITGRDVVCRRSGSKEGTPRTAGRIEPGKAAPQARFEVKCQEFAATERREGNRRMLNPMKRFLLGLVLLSLCLPGCQQSPAQVATDQAGLPPITGLFLAERRLHRGRRQGTRRRQVHGPRPSLLVYERAHRQSPGRCPQAGRQDRGHPRQEPAIGKVFVGRLRDSCRHPDEDRRQARHRPQQDHGHRRTRPSSRAASISRRPRKSTTPRTCWSSAARNWRRSTRPTGMSTRHIPTRMKARRKVIPKRTVPPQRRRKPHAPVASGYVASSRSQVFHRADCKGAAKISEKNLVHYATRDEAIQAGKRPCPECNP